MDANWGAVLTGETHFLSGLPTQVPTCCLPTTRLSPRAQDTSKGSPPPKEVTKGSPPIFRAGPGLRPAADPKKKTGARRLPEPRQERRCGRAMGSAGEQRGAMDLSRAGEMKRLARGVPKSPPQKWKPYLKPQKNELVGGCPKKTLTYTHHI